MILVFKLAFRFLLMISGFLLFFKIPSLVQIKKDHILVNFQTFWDSLKLSLQQFSGIGDPLSIQNLGGINLVASYQYTIIILFSCILFVSFFGILIAIIVMIVPHKATSSLKNFVNFFEAVPDLLIIFLFQIGVITLFKSTGLKFLQLFGGVGGNPYFIPIVTISFLPVFLLAQFLIKALEEEKEKMYVLYAKAKGFGNLRIFIVHIIRNIFSLYIYQLRTIVWVLLSNIVLVEYLFNIKGFTRIFYLLLFRVDNFPALFICLLIFTLPVMVVELVGVIVSRSIKGKEEIRI